MNGGGEGAIRVWGSRLPQTPMWKAVHTLFQSFDTSTRQNLSSFRHKQSDDGDSSSENESESDSDE